MSEQSSLYMANLALLCACVLLIIRLRRVTRLLNAMTVVLDQSTQVGMVLLKQLKRADEQAEQVTGDPLPPPSKVHNPIVPR